jgi:uncharacterized membrane-anchored protein YitT (DUF2179 family)
MAQAGAMLTRIIILILLFQDFIMKLNMDIYDTKKQQFSKMLKTKKKGEKQENGIKQEMNGQVLQRVFLAI